MRQPREDEGADDGAEERALAAQEHHGQDLHRLINAEIAGIDVARVVAVEATREGGEGIADGEGEELVAEHVDAEGAREILVERNGAEAAPRPGAGAPRAGEHDNGEEGEGEGIPGDGA